MMRRQADGMARGASPAITASLPPSQPPFLAAEDAASLDGTEQKQPQHLLIALIACSCLVTHYPEYGARIGWQK